MEIYHYSGITGEYIAASNYNPPPDVGLPAYATEIKPPVTKKGYVAVFKNEKWVQEEDNRGKTVYHTETRTPLLIEHLGDIPKEYTEKAPETDFDVWTGAKWKTDEKVMEVFYTKQKIAELEKTITPRRLRESVLGLDQGWLETIEAQIAVLRKGL